jgi:hypothetical protein
MLRVPSTMVLIREQGPHNVAINPARSAAQGMRGTEHQPGQRLLSAPSDIRRSRAAGMVRDLLAAEGLDRPVACAKRIGIEVP